MPFQTLALLLLLVSGASFAVGRSPAVEDFVGIEIEEDHVAPQGTESLYNLEQDIQRIEAQPKHKPAPKVEAAKAPAEAPSSASMVFGITLALGLPLMTWFMVMAHLKKKATLENASNIEVLERYRKEREKKSEENVRKVS